MVPLFITLIFLLIFVLIYNFIFTLLNTIHRLFAISLEYSNSISFYLFKEKRREVLVTTNHIYTTAGYFFQIIIGGTCLIVLWRHFDKHIYIAILVVLATSHRAKQLH